MTEAHLAEPVPRSGPEERDYLLGRAEDHRLRAETAKGADARSLHLRFESHYRASAARAMTGQFDQPVPQKDQERTPAEPVDAPEPAVLVRSGRNAHP